MRILLSACLALLLATPVLAVDEAKGPIRGLVSMGAYKFVSAGGDPVNTLAPLLAKPGIFGGIAIIGSWSQLQPTAGAALADNNVIDQALAEVRAYNTANPGQPLAVKLRVWSGFMAPEWAMSLGGAPIAITDGKKRRQLGRFWSPAYRTAWQEFQALLAARYDSEPLIHEVAVTSCMSLTAEPFFLSTDAGMQTPIRAAGFTDAAYQDCLTNAVADYAPWKTSRIVLAVNPFRAEANAGNGDPAFTEGVMQACRTALGERCVFDNHDLDASPPTPILPIYAAMQKLGPEVEFQTYRETPTDFEGTLQKGIALGATSIELWQDFGGFPLVPSDTLKTWAELFPE